VVCWFIAGVLPQSAFAIAGTILAPVLRSGCDQTGQRFCRTKYDKRNRCAIILTGERPAMNRNRIICFRLDQEINRRIARVLGSRYSTRSKFIRTAIEQLLLRDESQARLRAAQSIIRWG
jgi:hypothetical protein